jgi:hypothetical protein
MRSPRVEEDNPLPIFGTWGWLELRRVQPPMGAHLEGREGSRMS